jgi:hypothetical protein
MFGAPLVSGALGWTAAMVARIPIGIWLSKRQLLRYIVLASGPLEETARLCALSITGRSFASAIYLGLGWTAAEIIYLIVSRQVAFLARPLATPMTATTLRSKYLVVLWERISALAFHLGASLLIAFAPVTTPLMAIGHTGINWGVFALKDSVLFAELVAFVFSVSTLALALLVWHFQPR